MGIHCTSISIATNNIIILLFFSKWTLLETVKVFARRQEQEQWYVCEAKGRMTTQDTHTANACSCAPRVTLQRINMHPILLSFLFTFLLVTSSLFSLLLHLQGVHAAADCFHKPPQDPRVNMYALDGDIDE